MTETTSIGTHPPLKAGAAGPAFAVLGLSLVVFIVAQRTLYGLNGYWIDEYFSMWAADPRVEFMRAFTERVLPDTNPPLYFAALYPFRAIFAEPRDAFIALNAVCIGAALLFVLSRARAYGNLERGLYGAAAFVASGAVACYAPEGRAYLMAMCVVFATAWLAAETLEDAPAPLWLFVLLGLLGAATHVFAAIFAGGMGAALALAALVRRKRPLMLSGIALGASASIGFALWYANAANHMGNIGWIAFNAQSVKEALWYVKELAIGGLPALALLAGLIAWSIFAPRTRVLTLSFLVAFALFAVLPVLVSFRTPLVVGRYWAIGAPALAVLAAFLFWAHLSAARTQGWRTPVAAAAACAGLFLILSSISGIAAAQRFTEQKPTWEGVSLVRDRIAGCGAGTVHVLNAPRQYSMAANAPENVFVEAKPGLAPLNAARAACPVLGWAEHVLLGDRFSLDAPDAQLLALLNIEGQPGRDLTIRRHDSGFVVLRGPETQP